MICAPVMKALGKEYVNVVKASSKVLALPTPLVL